MILPRPYYQDGAVTIYHADCLDMIETFAGMNGIHKGPFIDVVITDPPYGVGDRPSGVRKRGKGSKASYGSYEDTDENHANTIVPAMTMCINKFCRVAFTPGIRKMFDFPRPLHVGSFQYGAGSTSMSAWGPILWQPILYYGKDPRPQTMTPDSFQGCNDHDDFGEHPCPKPLKSWKRLVDRASLPGEIILDPFMGSGTTLRAAKDLGRRAIGIEIDERYCEAAARRMRQEVLL